MERSELLKLGRRALDLAQAKTTDMAPTTMRRPASAYTDPEVFEREKAMVRAAPQLVGYRSELPAPGAFLAREVMGEPVVLTRQDDGSVAAFRNICAHRQARVVEGCGVAHKFSCPYHAWTYDTTGRLTFAPGADGFPELPVGMVALPAADYAGFLWVGLDPSEPLDVEAHLGELGAELESWGIGDWSAVGEKTLDAAIDWKLVVDTFSENYHFATVHSQTFAQIARSNCTVFDAFGPHHRLIFPMRGITELADLPEDEWEPINSFVVIYALHPNIVISVTPLNGELFRIYPTTGPGRSTTFHHNATSLDVTVDSEREGAASIFEYAHATVRDEDFTLAAKLQRNLETGLVPELLFGRNEPGLQHRHTTWDAAVAAG